MTAPLSPSDLAEIEARAKAATPGPWRVGHPANGQRWLWTNHGTGYTTRIGGATDEADAAYIARMDPATTLALLARVKRAEDAVARVREVHVESSGGDPYGDYIDHRACRHCRKAWPCPTIAALDADAAAGGAG